MMMRCLLGSIAAASLITTAAQAQTVRPPSVERYAVLVGVDAYFQPKAKADQLDPLHGPGKDVAMMRDLLVDAYQFPSDPEHLTTLVGLNATRAAIAAAFQSLIAKAKAHPGAVVVFYFSGHGSQSPDLNGDEPDGYDETIVASDSRVGAHDITDDEVFGWLQELRRHTPKITLIFDSCHSESGARAIGTRRSRDAPPENAAAARTASDLDAIQGAGDFLPPGRDYVFLSGARSYESSYEDEITTPTGKVWHGEFTYYLVQALMAHPRLTYRALIDEVTTALEKPSPDQHPQAEGAVDAPVFSEAGEDDPSLPIVGTPSGRRFNFAGGRLMGLQPGALLAVYASTATGHLVGEKDKLANARVVELGQNISVAELLDPLTTPLDPKAKVVVTTPFFGLDGQRVWLSDLPGQPTTAADHGLLGHVRTKLAVDGLVTPVASEDWDVALRRGCSVGGRLILATAATKPANCAAAYYLSPHNLDTALMGAFRAATPDLAQDLADLIEARAKQENIRGLANANGALEGKVRLALAHATLDPNAPQGFNSGDEFPAASSTTLALDDIYMVKVYNDSDQDLWIALALLGADGSVSLVTPSDHGEPVPAHTSSWLTRVPFKAQTPTGRKTYKAIASTHSGVNFRVITQPASARAGVGSALEWLLTSRPGAGARGDDAGQGLSLDDWTTARLDLDVRPKPAIVSTNPKKDRP